MSESMCKLYYFLFPPFFPCFQCMIFCEESSLTFMSCGHELVRTTLVCQLNELGDAGSRTLSFLLTVMCSRWVSSWLILSLLCRLLQTIIKLPPTRTLEVDEKQLVWKFRFSLMSEKKALTKFVRSVDWSDNQVSKRTYICKCFFCFVLSYLVCLY